VADQGVTKMHRSMNDGSIIRNEIEDGGKDLLNEVGSSQIEGPDDRMEESKDKLSVNKVSSSDPYNANLLSSQL